MTRCNDGVFGDGVKSCGVVAPHALLTDSVQRAHRLKSARISRGWRIVRTAIGFAAAAAFSVALWTLVMPLCRLVPGSASQKEIRAQLAIHWFTRVYLRGLRLLRVLRIQLSGAERLREPGTLVVANHPTLIDALVLLSLMPQADCVMKQRYYEDPFLGRAARGAGYITNRDGPGLVAECVERLMRGRSVIIFPEGTRSPANELGAFARGAAHIALRAGRDPVPVAIQCDPPTLHGREAWWEVPSGRFTLSLNVAQPLPVKEAVSDQPNRSRAARALTAALRENIERRITIGRV